MSFDNLFDEAMFAADNEIIDAMGANAVIDINGIKTPVRGVFDNPDATATFKTGGRLKATAPTFFVKSQHVVGIKERDEVVIKGESYWVEKIEPDDTGSRVLTLGTGKPGKPAAGVPGPKSWSGNK
ncbi:hypothetical protein D8682_26380 [Buttiauxella sp. 3AFRM03]|uniref:head-tail joining protein n=1 Tax=Buttiauxella sp. 3AFRM03 TaxID=2479367 RepID=UPI000EF77C07|nr:head-tail joining protein [Buttiauxella sp. 3AFRM03]AYN30195.1 hypothetical protein D8682_26380 [Buttiauxella sp. 3AFRM03]